MAKWKKAPEELIDQFYSALEPFDDIEMRKMFGYPCSFINGNMFTGLAEENWVLRLPEADREEIKALGALPFTPMGRVMREYVCLPTSILSSPEKLKGWIERSLAFVSSLPEKIKK